MPPQFLPGCIILLPERCSLHGLDLLLLRLLSPAPIIRIPIRISHLLITPTPTALMRAVVFLCHIGVGIRMEVFVRALGILICGSAVCACSDDFFFGRIDISIVQGCLD